MSLNMQFISVVIPIETIETKCKSIGGLKGVLKLNKKWVGKKILYDKYLYKDGAMSSGDIEDIIKFWKQQGLTPMEEINGVKKWKDLCVVDFVMGSTLPCAWLAYDAKSYSVSLKGKPRGRIVTRFKSHLLHKIRLKLNA